MMDVAMEQCGDPEALFAIALENGYGLTDNVEGGLKLNVPEVINQRVYKFYIERDVEIATIDDSEKNRPDGIGFMQIGVDFIVS